MLKIAIIGLGDIAHIHIPIIARYAQANLVAVCDVEPNIQIENIEGVPYYEDYKTMIDEQQIDCVHICLPHHLHQPVAAYCLSKNIHVFLEKPSGLNTKEAKQLAMQECESDAKICVCLQNRYNETVEALLAIKDSKQYGNVIGVKGLVTWHRPEAYYTAKPWRGQKAYAGGGVMINQALHTLDLMQLFGGKVERIQGTTAQFLPYHIDVEDTASAHLEFEHGVVGTFFATNGYAINDSVELQVLFERGQFTIKDSKLYEQTDTEMPRFLVEDTKMPGAKFYYGASHKKLIEQFYQAIMEDTKQYPTASDAVTVMEIIDAIQQSAQTKTYVAIGGTHV